MRWKLRWHAPLAVAAAGLLVAACGGSSPQGGTSSPTPSVDVGSGALTGAGATFPQPFYSAAFYQYNQLHPQVTINYQAIGSGGGIQQLTQNTVDFGASDVPMTSAELQAAGGADTIAQLPSTLGVVSIAYNLSGVDKLQIDGKTLADIYLGKVKTWNDPELTALNKGVSLPSSPITVAHRSDGSGTSYCFTDYLAKVSPEWKAGPGVGKSINWPVGIGGKGNEGVAQAVQQTAGSIGYVELAYVIQAKMSQAYVKNQDGKFMQASLQGATEAASHNTSVSATNFSITNEPGAGSYPLTTFSWIMLRKDQKDATKGKAVAHLFQWLVTDGQQYGKPLQYAPLPKQAATYATDQLKTLTTGGKPILS
jgi:phosphate transport system substrate-binding protein